MWANAQRDGRPAEYRWRPLFNAAKFGWRPLLECRAVTLPRRETTMCGSMVDIQSPTAEIRRGKKKEEEETTAWKYIWPDLLHIRAAINKVVLVTICLNYFDELTTLARRFFEVHRIIYRFIQFYKVHVHTKEAAWCRKRLMPCGILQLPWYEHVPVKLYNGCKAANKLIWLWPPYVIGQAIIFLPCGLFLSSFFPRLMSAAADWMSTILRHIVWPYSANLECRSEMCCTRLAGNTGRKKSQFWHHRTNLAGYIFGTKACIDNRKTTC